MSLSSASRNVKVFIADDSTIVRERLGTMLDELAGIDLVGQAGNVGQAINAVRRLKPDAVILDIRMPGGSGINVLQAIKQAVPAPLVIVLTNYPYPIYRERCLQVGADFFLDKSTEFDQIPALLGRLKQDLGPGATPGKVNCEEPGSGSDV
jgi:DNA-binding NarL/FixJ family response regulator